MIQGYKRLLKFTSAIFINSVLLYIIQPILFLTLLKMKDKKTRKKILKHSTRMYYLFLNILTGSDLLQRRLPIMVLESMNHGPIVWITACIHGDEIGSTVVVQEIFKRIKKKGLLKGTLYAFPLMNPSGFETSSRNIAMSKEDLNRAFPGDKNGSLAERIAKKIFDTIMKTKPSLVLDLHNDWRKSIPDVLIDPIPKSTSKKVYEDTKMLSKKIGFPVILDTDNAEKTITYNILKKNIPALVLELGESYVVNERDVENGVKAVWNILSHLKMVDNVDMNIRYDIPEKVKGKIMRYSQRPFSHASGIIRFLVKPNDIVKKGEPIAKIYNAFGKLLEVLNAENDCIVLGYSDYSVAFPGAAVMAFGILKEN